MYLWDACVTQAGLSATGLLQGLPALGVDWEGMRGILAEVAELAAASSIVMGELPEMTRSQGEDLLAEVGMLGMLSSGAPMSDPVSQSERYTCFELVSLAWMVRSGGETCSQMAREYVSAFLDAGLSPAENEGMPQLTAQER